MYVLNNILMVTGICVTSVPFDGLTIYNPNNGVNQNTTFMINNEGEVINSWTGADKIASTPYLLPGGELLRPCRVPNPPMYGAAMHGGRIQRFAYDGTLLWDFLLFDENNQPHHDICPMPNGNVLLLAWERKTQAQGQALGRQNLNSEIWPTEILEVEQTGPTSGKVVWEWHLWDHLIQDVDPKLPNYGVVSEHPEKLDINKGTQNGQGGDWVHANALDYNPTLDQIVWSANSLDEIFIIDHSTTTKQAAAPSGDFLYRWGNPGNYNRLGNHILWNVHGVNWIDDGSPGAGNILLFNNGNNDQISELIEFAPPLLKDGSYEISDTEPFEPAVGDYAFFYENSDFWGNHLCGVYRLPNGNTIATNGPAGEVREVDPDGNIVWQYFTGVPLMRAVKYPFDILDPPGTSCLGDINSDNDVNVTDLLAIINVWGCESCPMEDLSEDGQINVTDLLIVVGNWGACK